MKIRVMMTKQENADVFHVDPGDTVTMDINDYLVGVVTSEIGNAPLEACKAQAVAARTMVYPYVQDDKPVSDSSSKLQSFSAQRMNSNKYQNAMKAVRETNGELLFYMGKVISPCSYSSSNGGRTVSSKERWGGDRAWLIAQDDPWDKAITNGQKTGHGVGMSQSGAKYAASIGKTYKEILSFYYPNTCIKTMKGDDTMPVKASYQVEKFKYMADKKWKYVAGAAQEGTVDCSGAFTYWYKKAGGYMYHGSNTMWRQYSIDKGRIGKIDLVPGMAVYKWKNDGKEPDQYKSDGSGNFYHVGLYIGDNKVVEAKGTKYGVVYSSLEEWSHASRQKGTDYDVSESCADKPPSSSSPSFPVSGTVRTSGGILRVRKSPVDGEVLGKLSNGTKVTVIGETNGWYMIDYKGHTGYISGKYVSLGSRWNISVTVDHEVLMKTITAYLKEKGLTPLVEQIGG